MGNNWDWDAICRICDDEGDLDKFMNKPRRKNPDKPTKAQQKKEFREMLKAVSKAPRKTK